MKTKHTLAVLMLAFAAAGLMPVRAADTNAPSADAILRQMSDKLGAAQQFSFKVRREIDSELATGDGLPENATIRVTVQRPDKIMTRATGPDGIRYFYADGQNLSLFDQSKNLYSTVPLVASLDELPAKLATIYGFAPPLAEFVVSDPYSNIVWRAQSIAYAGNGTIKAGFMGLKQVPCFRLALTGKLADAELWIAVGDQLPRRLTATVKKDSGIVHITLDFSDWNLAANTKDADFVFTPAKGAMQIPMMSVAEMQAAAKETNKNQP